MLLMNITVHWWHASHSRTHFPRSCVHKTKGNSFVLSFR